MARITLMSVLILSMLFALTTLGYCDDPVKKLGRGICNVVTCPFELVAQPADVANSDGPFAAATYGVLKGIGMTVVRGMVGAYEIVTFPVPLPKDYKPILTDPEFFFEESIW